MRTIIVFVMMWELILIAGCQPPPADTDTLMEMTETSVPVLPTQGTIQMTPGLPTPADSMLQSLIEKASADLAQRSGLPVGDIVLLEATAVVWPDGSLGCPQEGMEYAQVLTPGYLIRLQFGDQEFEYHASRGTALIFCENPTPPVPGTPADT